MNTVKTHHWQSVSPFLFTYLDFARMATEACPDPTNNLRVLFGLVWQRTFPTPLRHALKTLKDVRLASLRGSRGGRHGDELVRA